MGTSFAATTGLSDFSRERIADFAGLLAVKYSIKDLLIHQIEDKRDRLEKLGVDLPPRAYRRRWSRAGALP
jgi:hypothetical protein